jgi:hypothetical protein
LGVADFYGDFLCVSVGAVFFRGVVMSRLDFVRALQARLVPLAPQPIVLMFKPTKGK